MLSSQGLILPLSILTNEQNPDPLLLGLRERPQAAAQFPPVRPLAQRPSHLSELRRVIVEECPVRQTTLNSHPLFHAAPVTL